MPKKRLSGITCCVVLVGCAISLSGFLKTVAAPAIGPMRPGRPTDAQATPAANPTRSKAKVIDLSGKLGIRRRLSPETRHSYGFSLATGDFLSLIVEQRQLDVSVDLVGPRKGRLVTVDSLNGGNGPEPLLLVAASPGTYYAIVTTKEEGSNGEYLLRLEARRPASPRDRSRAQASLGYYQARELLKQRPPNSAGAVAELLATLRLWELAGAREEQAEAWYELGSAYSLGHQWRQAIDAYTKALPLFRGSGRAGWEALTYIELGNCFRVIAETKHAQRSFLKAAELGGPATQAAALTNLGNLHAGRGEISEASHYLRKALALCEKNADVHGRVSALIGFANALTRGGLPGSAFRYLAQAMDLARDDASRVRILIEMGYAYVQAGSFESGAAAFLKALRLEREPGESRSRADILVGLGRAYLNLGKYAEAKDACRRALTIYQALDQPLEQASTLTNLGWLFAKMGRYQEALDSFSRALRFAPRLNNRALEAAILSGLAWTESRRGNPIAAQQSAERAVAVIESLRGEVEDSALRMSFFSSKQDTYDRLISILMQQHRLKPGAGFDVKAFEVSERAKARILLDSIERRRDRGGVETRLLTAAEIRRQVVDGQTLLLEYALGEAESYLWLVAPEGIKSFILPSESRIMALASQTCAILSKSHRREEQLEALRGAKQLSDILLGRVWDELGNKRLVIVAPGELQYVPFAVLPDPGASEMEADSEASWPTPLVAKNEIVYEPSASAVALLRRRRSRRKPAEGGMVVLGDAVFDISDARLKHVRIPAGEEGDDDPMILGLRRLPFSRQEAELIVKHVPAHFALKALGFEANRELILGARVGLAAVVHLATHAIIRPEQPETSAIVLSRYDKAGNTRDGLLRVKDIKSLDLRAELVVLSACSTARGKDVRGEGVIGLPQAFLSAGVSRVLMSLWNIQDRSTAEFMDQFYRAMFQDGRRPAAALRSTQLAMWRNPRRRPPSFWGGFILEGEWRGWDPVNNSSGGVSYGYGVPESRGAMDRERSRRPFRRISALGHPRGAATSSPRGGALRDS